MSDGTAGKLVVTGMGCVTPAGVGVAPLMAAWRGGVSHVRTVRRFDTSRLAVHLGGEMPDLGGGGLRGAASLRVALDEALGAAAPPPGSRALVIVATTKGFLERGRDVADRSPAIDASLPARWLAADLRSAHGFGPGAGAMTISTACTSGTAALAAAAIRGARPEGCGPVSEHFDVVVVAGIDLLSDFVYSGFAALGATDPAPCRPFDVRRAGMSPAEAAGVIILERETHAARRGARVLGRLLGWGLANDAAHPTAPDRDGRGLASAATTALATAGIAPGDLGHVHAHGTGTRPNDAMECRALESTLGGAAVPVTTLKGTIGHTFGASGVVETIASVAAVAAGVVPPITNCSEPEPSLAFARAPCALRSATFLKLGAGFGGFNAAVVISGVPR